MQMRALTDKVMLICISTLWEICVLFTHKIISFAAVLLELGCTLVCQFCIAKPKALNIKKKIHPLEVVSRYRDPQPQVGENYSYLAFVRQNCKHTLIENVSVLAMQFSLIEVATEFKIKKIELFKYVLHLLRPTEYTTLL